VLILFVSVLTACIICERTDCLYFSPVATLHIRKLYLPLHDPCQGVTRLITLGGGGRGSKIDHASILHPGQTVFFNS
jgi:hypothetical protein